MLIYQKQDITTVTYGVIGHGVNCQGVMGAGAALALKRKWPIINDMYRSLEHCNRKLLGQVQLVVIVPDQLYVVNMFTQFNYGRHGRYADIGSIESTFTKLLHISNVHNLPIYMPKIGAGFGGLNWNTEVEPSLQDCIRINEYKKDITICEL
jgi:O-acetyl-ADP-ribose deacetylase (regulator of RNase III)